MVKLQLGDLRKTGQVVGRLSSFGTLGAITATLGTGFIFVAAMPSSWIMLTLAGAAGGGRLGAGLVAAPASPSVAQPGKPRTRAVLATVGLVGAGLGALAPTPCDVETAYHCARVDEDPSRAGGRTLILNSARHSYVDLNDPEHLEFAYVQWIGAVADTCGRPAAPINALHLGGGGFTVPDVRRGHPARAATSWCSNWTAAWSTWTGGSSACGPGPTCGSGSATPGSGWPAQRTGAYDLVVGDAFGHLVVPWHLATREMAADIARVLQAGRRVRAERHRLPAGPVHPGRAGHGGRGVPARRAGRAAGRAGRARPARTS